MVRTLRGKIALLLMVLVGVSVGAFFALVTSTFERDKAAYVYDGNARVAEVVASEVEATLNAILNTMSLIGISLDGPEGVETRFQEAIKAMFVANPLLVDVAVYDGAAVGADLDQPKSYLFRTDVLAPYGLDRAFLVELRRVPLAKASFVAGERFVVERSTLHPEVPLIRVGLQRTSGEKQQFVLATVRTDKIQGLLGKAGAQTVFLVDRRGDVIAATTPEVTLGERHATILGETTGAFAGATETDVPGGGRVVLAYAKTFDRALTVISEVPVDVAFLASRQFVQTMVAFLGLVICVAFAAAVLFSRRLTGALSKLNVACRQVAAGDFSFKTDVKSRDEIGALATAFQTMSAKISDLLIATAQKAEQDKELATARTVQSAFFAKASQGAPGSAKVIGRYVPASQCGGDWWGHFQLGKGVEMIVIGDAMGHGAPAALVTAMAYTYFEALVRDIGPDGSLTVAPSVVLERLNDLVAKAFDGGMYMTMNLTMLDIPNRKATVVNAGHVFPVVLSGEAEVGTKYLSARGAPLGSPIGTKLQQREVPFDHTRRIVFYTDGLTEARPKGGKAYGLPRVCKLARQLVDAPSSEAMSQLFGDVEAHLAGTPAADDIAIVIVDLPRP